MAMRDEYKAFSNKVSVEWFAIKKYASRVLYLVLVLGSFNMSMSWLWWGVGVVCCSVGLQFIHRLYIMS